MNRKHKMSVIFSLGGFGIVLFISVLVMIRNNVFKSKSHFYTRIETARGLNSYPPVFFKGYTVGKVSGFSLSEDQSIKVDFFIFEEYRKLMFKNTIIEKNQNILSGQITDFRLILPVLEHRQKELTLNSFVPESSSPEARELFMAGIVENQRQGIVGIVNKVNGLLDSLDRENTPEKVSKLLKLMNGILGESKRTIASYNAVQSPEVKDKVLLFIKKTNQGIDSVNENLDYLRDILQVIHHSREDIAPIILKTSQALDDAEDTLEGINNNPLIRGGIRKSNKDIQLEIFD